MLTKVGVKVHRLLRTGAIKSMTYGQAIMGVSDSMLRNLRRTTGAASSTAGGPGGQNLDIQLMAADGGPKGKADPAFDSHELPIGQWALAMWESWLPQVTMMKMVAAKLPILIRAPRPWSRVYGPAAAFIATCARLKWTVIDAGNVITDTGQALNLLVDPPAEVVRQVAAAVRRWRWRNIERAIPQLELGEHEQAAVMQPIYELLRSTRNDKEWNPNLRGYLKSANAGRQWPQTRLMSANLSSHSACAFCLYDKIEMIRISAAAGKEGHDWFIDLALQARTAADATPGISQKKKTMRINKAESAMLEDPQKQMLIGVPRVT